MRKILDLAHTFAPSIKSVVGILLISLLASRSAYAQLPPDLPWPGSPIEGQTVILQPGIAAASCGTTIFVPSAERFTFGLFNIDGVIPDSGRVDVTGSVEVYHHPSWLVAEIGNIFGVAINERTGDIFLSASSNYGAGFLGQPSVLQYGAIGGGADSLSAAGTVYRLDAVTGQASVFAVLPQQTATFTHIDCEELGTETRTTGVGLGNIHYDSFHDQYFVTNIEDGRIYRLDTAGNILDSYDPGLYDDGAPGITSLTDLVYGLAVEPGGRRLFFGGTSTMEAVPLWSIDLSASGGFFGSVDDTTLPPGADWSNYVGTETLHTILTVETKLFLGVHYLSDLEFTSGPRLLAGVRRGCDSNWFSSYNHGGESNLISPDAGGLYNASITEFDVSVFGLAADEDAYGGVSDYHKAGGGVDFVVSSSDMLNEDGPHGLAVFRSADAALIPIDPLAVISYGAVDGMDPKGVGGSVDVFNRAFVPITEIPTLGGWGLALLTAALGWAAFRTMRRRRADG